VALTAFNPMFLFISAAVNNDSLAILLSHLALLLLLIIWQDKPNPTKKWWLYLGLGLILGLGILTKLSVAGL
jgi:4-amino-4-deoxy-L-arabinose transferase-like glycosyltransferase